MKTKIIVLVGLFIAWSHASSTFALSGVDKNEIDESLEKIHEKVETYSLVKQEFIYKYLIRRVNSKLTTENRQVYAYIISGLQKNISSSDIVAHNSTILRFTSGSDMEGSITAKKDTIIKNSSVFIFRTNTKDLSFDEIQRATKELKKQSPNLLIFIDQEGGLVNRYIDFTAGIGSYLDDTYIIKRLEHLNDIEKDLLLSIFPKTYGYFPSMGKIGITYDNFSTPESQALFLEIVAYVRLKSLQEAGINTYGLVADLNLGNPAITLSGRSFSQHTDKYKKLVDAFIKASNETGSILYLKHFPGHGAGTVDSHKGILDLSDNSEYLRNNMEVFEYFLDNKKSTGGLMLGHIVFNEELLVDFNRIVGKADFLLTDDLAMQGFKQMQGAEGESVGFSTNIILNHPNLIKVDTQYVESVY